MHIVPRIDVRGGVLGHGDVPERELAHEREHGPVRGVLPREGPAQHVAAVEGGEGLAVAVAYGAIVLVATLPGAVLLLVGRRRRPRLAEEATAHG